MSHEDLLKQILEDKPPLPPEDERLHNAISRVFNGQRNKAIAQMTLAALFALCLIVGGMSLLRHVPDQRDMLFGVVLVMAGLELNVLMKLWYWITDNKISVLKEQKTTQLMIAQLKKTDESEATPSGAIASSGVYKESEVSFWGKFETSTCKRISKGIIWVGVLAVIFACVL